MESNSGRPPRAGLCGKERNMTVVQLAKLAEAPYEQTAHALHRAFLAARLDRDVRSIAVADGLRASMRNYSVYDNSCRCHFTLALNAAGDKTLVFIAARPAPGYFLSRYRLQRLMKRLDGHIAKTGLVFSEPEGGLCFTAYPEA